MAGAFIDEDSKDEEEKREIVYSITSGLLLGALDRGYCAGRPVGGWRSGVRPLCNVRGRHNDHYSGAIHPVTVYRRPFETTSLLQLVYEVILHPITVYFSSFGAG